MAASAPYSTLDEAAGRAQAFNSQVDLSAIDSATLDEMFSHGDPVLAVVDLDSGFNFALDKRRRRTTEDWRQVLAAGKRQGLDPSSVVRDGGARINSGARRDFPDAEQGDVTLHAMVALTKVLRAVEYLPYSGIRRVDVLSADLAAALANANPKKLRINKLRADLRDAKARLRALMDEHAELEAASRRPRRALDVVDTEAGCLRAMQHTQAEVEAVATQLIATQRRDSRKADEYYSRERRA